MEDVKQISAAIRGLSINVAEETENGPKEPYVGRIHPVALPMSESRVVAERLYSWIRSAFDIEDPLPLGPDALISGSALLCALLNAKWSPNDLDIYCRPGAVTRMRNSLMGAGLALVDINSYHYKDSRNMSVELWTRNASKRRGTDRTVSDDSPEARAVCAKSLRADLDHYDPNTPFSRSSTGPFVQLIVEHEKDISMVFGRFDLHILENTFDGIRVQVNYPQQLMTRTSTTRKDRDPTRFRTEERLEKYRKRGIEIVV